MRSVNNRLLLRYLWASLIAVYLFGNLPVALSAYASPPLASPSPVTKKRSSAAQRKKKLLKTKHNSRRIRRMAHAFVVSSDLKPMARQLLENRTPAAYAGVQAYARKHSRDDAGALALLVVGYAHISDREYASAIAPLVRAQRHAGDLGDYVGYFLASAYGGAGDSKHVIATLANFEKDYPDSLFARDAYVVYANALLVENQADKAIALLERYRQPVHADLELALGRAYIASGNTAKGADTLRRIYLALPLSSEAEDAARDLQKVPPASVVPYTFAESKMRADLLAQARHYSDAATEYRALLGEATGPDRSTVQLALGVALHRSGHDKDARELLEAMTDASGEANAQRLYELTEIARSAEDQDAVEKLVANLRQTSADSPWFGRALLTAANMRLLKREYDPAIDLYREIEQRFPDSSRASFAHWKTTWLNLRHNRTKEARRGLEEQIAKYPGSQQVPAALYWRARLADQDQDTAKARAFYTKLTDRFRNYYYANLARQRLADLAQPPSVVDVSLPSTAASGSDPASEALLEKIPPANLPTSVGAADVPADDVRVQKALLLQNGALTNFAVRELRAAMPGSAPGWATSKIADLYQDSGQYDRAIEVMKRAVPEYFSFDTTALPRSYWLALFPRPYWTDLKKYSAQNRLDPFLVASLIRQESEFNPGAISRANAMGLMQLLAPTAKKVARDVHMRPFSSALLLVPNANLQLGTRYFRGLVDQFGSVEYALAAYNAGTDRVQDWLAAGNFREPAEFVESIPFTETREYVQAIMRNSELYRRLYQTP